MKKFVFTLQKLYDVKASEEKAQRARLKELEKNLETYQRQRDANQRLYDREQAAYQKKAKEGMSVFEVQRYGDFFQYLEKEMRQQDQVIQSAKKSIDDCRDGLVKLINEQNVLDRLREDQRQEYLKEVAKEDDKTIEDFLQARL